MESILLPIMSFAFATCITPGPNNIMLTASGANFGFFRTIPHLLGISFGFECLLFAFAFGFNALFSNYPNLQVTLKIASSMYLLYLAWKIAAMKKSDDLKKKNKPITFLQAATFQLLNPKAMMMAISAMSTFTLGGENYRYSAFLVMLIFLAILLPCNSAWAVFGISIGKFLKGNRAFRTFNLMMGVLTASSVIMILM